MAQNTWLLMLLLLGYKQLFLKSNFVTYHEIDENIACLTSTFPTVELIVPWGLLHACNLK